MRSVIPSVGPLRILVVDDDDDTVDLLALYFQRAGWRTQRASCVAEASRLLKSNSIDVLVADLHLVDGDSSLLLANGRPAGLRVALVVTGDRKWTEQGKLDLAAFDAILEKPTDGKQLVALIAQLAGEH